MPKSYQIRAQLDRVIAKLKEVQFILTYGVIILKILHNAAT